MKILVILKVFWLTAGQDCNLPINIQPIINASNFELVNSNEITSNWRTFLEADCPTIASGDFNGDGQIDYAALLTNDKVPYQLVVIHSSGNSYKLIKLLDIGFGIYPDGLGFGIQTTNEQNVNGINESIIIKNDAILFSKFESSSQLFYWNDGKYEQLWIGD